MKNKGEISIYSKQVLFVLIFLGLFVIFSAFQIFTLKSDVKKISTELASTTQSLQQKTTELAQGVSDLHSQTIGISTSLSTTINDVRNQVSGVEQNVGSISGTLGTLQKLSQIDSEILKKYSKVFFMNENYVPAHLSELPQEYVYSKTEPELFLTEARPFLVNLLSQAKSNGIDLYVKSAFRSFDEQQSIKSAYTVTFGAGTANTFSADQGYSEHQLGTTVDFITTGLNGELDGFEKTKAYEWLTSNAHRFGFILSYPKNNDYYVFEPWHWRFVGVKLATQLSSNNLNFYDVEQREIDAYLINTFDQN